MEFRLAEFVNAGDGYSIVTVCSVFLKIIYYLFIITIYCDKMHLPKECCNQNNKYQKTATLPVLSALWDWVTMRMVIGNYPTHIKYAYGR